jgi:hypothetical protein
MHAPVTSQAPREMALPLDGHAECRLGRNGRCGVSDPRVSSQHVRVLGHDAALCGATTVQAVIA